MKIVILTSNAIRHKFVANTIAKAADEVLVISECKPLSNYDKQSIEIKKHFSLREDMEKIVFSENDFFVNNTLPIIYKDVNSEYVYSVVKEFGPDMIFCFGAAIVKEPLLSLLPPGHFINLHLGLSPYYRGSGTNFWPFVNKELEYLGSTIMYIDAGIDTGDILCHVTIPIESGDTVHSVGCKIIRESAYKMVEIINKYKNNEQLNRVKQWDFPEFRYFKIKDFNDDVLDSYYTNLKNGLVNKYINGKKKSVKLINL